MKIRLSQLKRIIKEEVKRTLKEAVSDHERPDQARSKLRQGVTIWVAGSTKQELSKGWNMLTAALRDLIGLEGLTDNEALAELSYVTSDLNLSEDEERDLEGSVIDWLAGN